MKSNSCPRGAARYGEEIRSYLIEVLRTTAPYKKEEYSLQSVNNLQNVQPCSYQSSVTLRTRENQIR